MKRRKVTENTTLPFTGKAPNEHQAMPVRQTANRSRAAETLEAGAPGVQEAAHALDAELPEEQACEAEMKIKDPIDVFLVVFLLLFALSALLITVVPLWFVLSHPSP